MSKTVIVGGGIIGLSTAYYLSQSPGAPSDQIHIVEASPRFFASASGFAAGFLARDWFSPATAALGALSFDLHKELAENFNGRERWGYSPSTSGSLNLSGVAGGPRGEDWLRDGTSRAEAANAAQQFFKEGEGPSWLTHPKGTDLELLSGGESTAQVDPLKLCQFLLEQCKVRNVQIHQPAEAISISQDLRGEISSVRIAEGESETDIPCTHVVFTAGAWTPTAFSRVFPQAGIKIPVTPLAGHSLVVKSPRWTEEHEIRGCHAVFTADPRGFSPEIFSRLGGEIYLAGVNSSTIPLPEKATESEPQRESMQQLEHTAKQLLGIASDKSTAEGEGAGATVGGQLSGSLSDLELVREGLCFRPVTPSGKPILTRIQDDKLGYGISTRGGGEGGVFVSAGHGPWGISMSLGTGKVLAEMVQGLQTSADVSALGI
ncbi:FAD dependent oxidoreductase-like protein [Xylona heveae TC161]|uniref:FAD dependent oxidoreductase-like protein n=1 Tax=Xylona heveae (strain CBS 132557 / TC161) TaxID=1328760 RepID=A0A165FQ97_XYLHT|nr:FAD dependent oxidoreductase-like protein [Xylona heveae TC161]KZF21251.1 FAD dependent oxidoreductase-like protein [Xylona heveae TC161]